jgi:shikimate kinase
MDPSALYERLKTRQSTRPLIKDLSGPELKEYISLKLSERESYYSKAKYTVDGSRRDVEEIIRIAGI